MSEVDKVNAIYAPQKFYNSVTMFDQRFPVLALTAATTLSASQSGAKCTLGTAGGFTVTLPAPEAGLNFEFAVAVAPTTAYYISSADAANIIYGGTASAEDAAGSTVNAQAADRIDFVANKAIIGDSVKIWSDGTKWFVTGFCAVQDGIVLTQVA